MQDFYRQNKRIATERFYSAQYAGLIYFTQLLTENITIEIQNNAKNVM